MSEMTRREFLRLGVAGLASAAAVGAASLPVPSEEGEDRAKGEAQVARITEEFEVAARKPRFL